MFGMGLYQLEAHCREFRMELLGGSTNSIFPEAEKWLLKDSDHAHALEHVARRKKMENYTSMMDFLFCELFLEYRQACFAFYEKRGPMLKEMITEEQRTEFERILLVALRFAYDVFGEKRAMNWTRFRCEALQAAA